MMILKKHLYQVLLLQFILKVVLAFSPLSQLGVLPHTRPNNDITDTTTPHRFFSPGYCPRLMRSSALCRTKLSKLSAVMLDPNMAIESTTTLISATAQNVLSNESIKKAFSLATFGPQYLWILMIFFPNRNITKKVMGGYWGILAFSLVHLFIVIASLNQESGTAPIAEFNGVFDPSPDADPQAAMIGMMRYPNFVSEEWSHVLTWDLFVGRFIWLDGLKRGIFTPHSVLLCNLIGPPGYLLHCVTCILTGKGLIGNEAEELDDIEE